MAKQIINNKISKWRNPIAFVGSIILILFIWFMYYVIQGLPPVEELENPKPMLASNVYSIDGELIGQFFRENRVKVNIKEINKSVINALIATEDVKFYNHWGVDIDRFVKAMVKTMLGSRQGASTITQQLAKNIYGLKDKNESSFETVVRKVREWITAVQIEKKYTKNEILEMYLNQSYFGNGAYGIEMAAKLYFNKTAKELSVPEAAVLIGLLKSSVHYDPVRKYNNALQRRNLIISRLYDTDFITERQYKEYRLMPIKVNIEKVKSKFKSEIAPHFVEYIRQQMEKWTQARNLDLYEDGLSIYTTLDSRMQKIANSAVEKHLNPFQQEFNKFWNWERYKDLLNSLVIKFAKESPEYKKAKTTYEKQRVLANLKTNPSFIAEVKRISTNIEVGFIAMDVKTGEIRAMIGGRENNAGLGLNHTTQIKRQPGSSFKPIIYLTAINNGLYPAYPILNSPFNYKGWSPRNFEGDAGGYMTLRNALKQSKNIVSARLIYEGYADLKDIGKNARAMGIKSKLDLVPAISLGTGEVAPLELLNVYQTIANKGIHIEPISILKIEDKSGILLESFNTVSNEAISEETAYIITDMLGTVINEGTAAGARSRFNFRRPAGGKTGTTQDYADAWFMGFTPQIAAGVWVGFDDRRITFTGSYGQGGRAAMPIWAIFMHDVYDELDLPMEDFKMPANGNVIYVDFCYDSIYNDGNPRVYDGSCGGGIITDIINSKDVPGSPEANIKRNYQYIQRNEEE